MGVRQRHLLMTLVLAGAVGVLAIAAPSASAKLKVLPNGQVASYLPLRVGCIRGRSSSSTTWTTTAGR